MMLVYIAGLQRSGTTFLQFLLSSRPEVVGLGELALVASRLGDGKTCSCGAPASTCPFWSPILPELQDLPVRLRIARILQYARDSFPERMVVDSSKDLSHLQDLYVNNSQLDPVRLKVLFLVRDFRGWVNAFLRHLARAGKTGFRHSYLPYCYLWLRANQRYLRYLRARSLSHLCVSYERLVFDTRSECERIARFLELPPHEDLNLGHALTHELYGNSGLKFDVTKRSQIVYDAGWMRDARPLGLAAFLLPVIWFNQRFYDRWSVEESPFR